MARRILINVADGDECRIAVVEDGRLLEYFVDRPSQLKHVGNIYKATVNNVGPGIQAAFVDMGLPRNGFLHVSDVLYAYQNTPKLTDLFPTEMRIKEPISDDAILGSSAEQDVSEAEADDNSLEETDSSSDQTADEAEFLETLERSPDGHKVTDSPLSIDEPEKNKTRRRRPRTAKKATAKAVKKPVAEPDKKIVKKTTRRPATKKPLAKKVADDASSAVANTGDAKPAVKAKPATRRTRKPAAKKPVSKTTTKVEAKADKPQVGVAKAKPSEASKKKASAESKAKRTRKPKQRGHQTAKPANPEITMLPGSRPVDGYSGDDGSAIPDPKRFHRSFAKIQNLVKRGQEVVVQVNKASQGGKGPGVSTMVSLPGRYMVLTPNSDRGGVSRKIEDGKQRNILRKMLKQLPVPEGMGIIIRTAAIDRTYEDLLRDLNYLLRMWSVVAQRVADTSAPALLYSDSDPAIRTVRDYFTADTDEILIDDREVFDRVKDFFEQLMPSFVDRVKLYEGDVPLFFEEALEGEIEHIFDKKVKLKSGGYLFMEQTEALVSIDVNSGKFTSAGDAEKTAYLTNMEAIPEICRQLRLRDMGGIVCNDLIDMQQSKHISDVEKLLRKELRKDRARTKVARMSPFGVIEMTRQRVRPSIKNYNYVACPTCAGFGMVRSAETLCLSLIRRMKMALIEDRVCELAVQVHPHVLGHLHSEFRSEIDSLEEKFGKRIVFEYARDLVLGQSRFYYINDRGGRVFYDMDQRINNFSSESGKKSQTNVPVPAATTGQASPDVEASKGEGKKKRRRRGGRKQREREQVKREREQRIKDQSGDAVNFGDKLPEAKLTMVKEEPAKTDGQKPEAKTESPKNEKSSKPSRRRGRRRGSGRGKKVSTDASKTSDSAIAKPEPVAAKPVAKAETVASTAKPEVKKPVAKKSAAKKTTVKKPAAKKPTATKKVAATKTATKKAEVKKPAVKKAVAKKPAV
ncbi:MAG: Rne/Rng family ribonuclease, partial [Planctomycetes bacterium]|nr:Rne/Rng family ribonuclease [Planctomycetota bacterium]